MKHFQKYHSVLAFLGYVAICQFKTASFIDGIILGLMFANIVVDYIRQFKTAPDIRKETIDALAKQKEDFESQLKFVMTQNSTAIKAMEKEVSDIKTKVASVAAVKTVGMSNARF